MSRFAFGIGAYPMSPQAGWFVRFEDVPADHPDAAGQDPNGEPQADFLALLALSLGDYTSPDARGLATVSLVEFEEGDWQENVPDFRGFDVAAAPAIADSLPRPALFYERPSRIVVLPHDLASMRRFVSVEFWRNVFLHPHGLLAPTVLTFEDGADFAMLFGDIPRDRVAAAAAAARLPFRIDDRYAKNAGIPRKAFAYGGPEYWFPRWAAYEADR